jgi:hypothetical protein
MSTQLSLRYQFLSDRKIQHWYEDTPHQRTAWKNKLSIYAKQGVNPGLYIHTTVQNIIELATKAYILLINCAGGFNGFQWMYLHYIFGMLMGYGNLGVMALTQLYLR